MLLSLVMPYYRNPRMLSRHLQIWAREWPQSIKDQVEIVIVDDGSPEQAAAEFNDAPAGLPAHRVYRILEDRPWHQHAARNLGAYEATTPWLLMTDMDHVVPADTMRALLDCIECCDVLQQRFFVFQRRDAPAGEPWKSDHWSTMKKTVNAAGDLKPHVNSFAMPRWLYWHIGGYDEDYCGIYGTDKRWRERMHGAAFPVQIDYPLIRVGREVIPDASTRDVVRKEESRHHLKKAVERRKRERGEEGVIKTLQFPWERVK